MVVSASIFALTTTRISRHNAIKRIVLPKFIFPNRYSSYSCFMLLHSENVLQTSFMFSHTEIRIIYQNNVYKDDSSNEAADAATHFKKHCKFYVHLLGCIKTRFCKKIYVCQHLSSLQDVHTSTPAERQHFRKVSMLKSSYFGESSPEISQIS